VVLITFFLIGAFLGFITGVPLGPVNFAVIDSAYRHHVRRAVGVALGGATADCIYATLGAIGVGPKITQYPLGNVVMYGISAVVLIAYGWSTLKAAPEQAEPTASGSMPTASVSIWSGYWLGLILILLNPGALLFWVLLFGARFGDATTLQGGAAALGVGVGSACWFCFVAWAANRGKRFLSDKAAWIGRIIGTILMLAGVVALWQGTRVLITEVL